MTYIDKSLAMAMLMAVGASAASFAADYKAQE